jgi:hypothetical protein
MSPADRRAFLFAEFMSLRAIGDTAGKAHALLNQRPSQRHDHRFQYQTLPEFYASPSCGRSIYNEIREFRPGKLKRREQPEEGFD